MKNIRSRSRFFEKRPFFLSFSIALSLLILLGGLLLADYHCRSAALGDATPPLSFSETQGKTYLHIDALGLDKAYDVTGGAQAWNLFLEIICVRQR